MYEALLVVYLFVAVCIVALVLLQNGKGADAFASASSGASGTLFGSSGSGGFMVRLTAVLAALFFAMSLILTNMSSARVSQRDSSWSDLDRQSTEDKERSTDLPTMPESSRPERTLPN